MTEQKPVEQYNVIPNMDVLTKPVEGNNGHAPATPTIDEQSRQEAMGKAMFENGLTRREQTCGAEINTAVQAILAKYRCVVTFIEQRDVVANRVMRVSLQPIAIERTQQGEG